MAHAERIDETLQRNVAATLDRGKEIAHRGFAVALDLLQLELGVALLQREDVGGLPHPTLVEEVLQLLLAEPIDVEGAARHEQFQMFDLLERTGELAGAAGARAFLAGCRFLAYDVGVQRAWAILREVKFLRALRPLVDHDIDDLRNHVAGALDHDGVAEPDVATLAQLLALVA